MITEDFFLEDLRNTERKVLEQRKVIEDQAAALSEKEKALSEKDHALSEKEKALEKADAEKVALMARIAELEKYKKG
jgi:uncharacterized protein (DUF3084 family)